MRIDLSYNRALLENLPNPHFKRVVEKWADERRTSPAATNKLLLSISLRHLNNLQMVIRTRLWSDATIPLLELEQVSGTGIPPVASTMPIVYEVLRGLSNTLTALSWSLGIFDYDHYGQAFKPLKDLNNLQRLDIHCDRYLPPHHISRKSLE